MVHLKAVNEYSFETNVRFQTNEYSFVSFRTNIRYIRFSPNFHIFPKRKFTFANGPRVVQHGTAADELENHQRHLGEASLPEMRGLQDMLHEVNPNVSYLRHGIAMMPEQGASDVGIFTVQMRFYAKLVSRILLR